MLNRIETEKNCTKNVNNIKEFVHSKKKHLFKK